MRYTSRMGTPVRGRVPVLPRGFGSLAFFLLAAPLALAACKRDPAAGKSCNSLLDDVTCGDPQTRFTCEAGMWKPEVCLGPGGCKVSGDLVECDTTLAAEAAPCSTSGDVACSRDRKSMLRCAAGKWTLSERCLGPGACTSTERSVLCDSTLGVEGEICRADPAAKVVEYVCSTDHKSVLTCKDAAWKKVESCAGARGCTVVGKAVDCDGSTASAGDFCVKQDKPDYACTTDRKARLECAASGWKVESTCLGEKGCTISGLDVTCDDSVREPGSPCEKEDEGSAVCGVDKKTMLECKAGKFVKYRTCPRACKVSEKHVGCE